jgi:hypothetical protein
VVAPRAEVCTPAQPRALEGVRVRVTCSRSQSCTVASTTPSCRARAASADVRGSSWHTTYDGAPVGCGRSVHGVL